LEENDRDAERAFTKWFSEVLLGMAGLHAALYRCPWELLAST
jgi:hypothetical protein